MIVIFFKKMPLYADGYYNAAALLGGAHPGMTLVRNATKVRKGSAAAKAKMAALRALRGKKRRGNTVFAGKKWRRRRRH